MRAFFAEENQIKRDEVAAPQLHALKEHQGPREKKLRLSDVKTMFEQIKDIGQPYPVFLTSGIHRDMSPICYRQR
jgi:hypothetical protein